MGNANKIYNFPINELQKLSLTMENYQVIMDETISRVKMEVGDLSQGHIEIRKALDELMSRNQIASTKEDNNMNESIAELKERTSSIDNTVRQVEKEIVSLKSDLKHTSDKMNSNLDEIKKSLDSLNTSMATLIVQSAEHGKDISFMKETQKDLITNKKFYFTSALTIIGLAVTIYRLYFV